MPHREVSFSPQKICYCSQLLKQITNRSMTETITLTESIVSQIYFELLQVFRKIEFRIFEVFTVLGTFLVAELMYHVQARKRGKGFKFDIISKGRCYTWYFR